MIVKNTHQKNPLMIGGVLIAPNASKVFGDSFWKDLQAQNQHIKKLVNDGVLEVLEGTDVPKKDNKPAKGQKEAKEPKEKLPPDERGDDGAL